MKHGVVIAGFPGIGKSYLFNNEEFSATDSDSSQFSWIVDDSGAKLRNPEFPGNYIDHIKKAQQVYDVVLVSTHKDVRNALDAASISYALVYPSCACRSEYLQRYIDRGSPESFCKMMEAKFNDFVTECMDHESFEANHYLLEKGEFLSTVVSSILDDMNA